MSQRVVSRAMVADYYPTILEDPAARRFVRSVGYHGYWGDGFSELAGYVRRNSGLSFWMTEICCMPCEGSECLEATWRRPLRPAFEEGAFWGEQLVSDLEAGASAWLYWNMILDARGGPWLVSPEHGDPEGNAQNAVVHIDRESHEVTYTGLYYYLAHFSRFVRPGAVRVATTPAREGGVRAVSFVNADGVRVTELLHAGAGEVQARVRWRGLEVRLAVPARSIVTLRWRG